MILFPNAKINIGLSVFRKRKDGYHDIESVIYPVGLYDAMEYIEDKQNTGKTRISISYTGPISIYGRDICLKVIDVLKNKFILPDLKIHIHKNIPAGAGLGGGSSDAAFLLKSLNDSFSFGLNEAELERLAADIGSDCPFFIRNRPCLVTGRGEILQDISPELKGYYLLLIYPGIRINTKEAYAELLPGDKAGILFDLIKEPVEQWKDLIKNQFEDMLFRKYHIIAEIRDELYRMGASYASISGSGSTVFGLFKSEVKKLDIFAGYYIYQEYIKQ